jgi:hypothetical protein
MFLGRCVGVHGMTEQLFQLQPVNAKARESIRLGCICIGMTEKSSLFSLVQVVGSSAKNEYKQCGSDLPTLDIYVVHDKDLFCNEDIISSILLAKEQS